MRSNQDAISNICNQDSVAIKYIYNHIYNKKQLKSTVAKQVRVLKNTPKEEKSAILQWIIIQNGDKYVWEVIKNTLQLKDYDSSLFHF